MESEDEEDDVDMGDGDDAGGAARAPASPLTVASAGLDAFLIYPSAPAPNPLSTLSPDAAPFHPGGTVAGRSKARRWADGDLSDAADEDSMPTSMASYLEDVLRGPLPSRTSARPAAPLPHSRPPSSGCGDATLGRRVTGRRGGSVVDRGHNLCTACRLAQWRTASRHTSASAAIDGSLLPTMTGGGRSSTGRRRVRRPPPLRHLALLARLSHQIVGRPGAFRPICTASASTASHPRTGWPPAGCPSDACDAGAIVTSRVNASCQDAMDGHDGASGSLPRATGFVPRAALRARTVLLWARLL
jgi:hypothetical protein